MKNKKAETISEESEQVGIDVNALKSSLLKQVRDAGGIDTFINSSGGSEQLLKSLMKPVMELLLECEMESHLGYAKHSTETKPTSNRRNGASRKTVRGDFGEIEVRTPRDREGTFEPRVVEKRQTSAGKFTEKIISLYTRGLSTREIEEHLYEIYGVDVSPQFISRATAELEDELVDWQNRPLDEFYPIVYVDGLWISSRSGENKGSVTKKCVYVVLGVGVDGRQEVLGLWLQNTEGARFWLKVFNDLQARGVNDILILCGDGLNGLPEAAISVFPQVDVQLCVVHQIRNATRFVSYQHRREFCRDMKPLYASPTIEAAETALAKFEKKWGKQYPASIDSWKKHWDRFTAFLKYPVDCRKLIYTTNSIESLNAQLRKNTRNRKVFPTENSALILLYLNIQNFTEKWTKRHNWDNVMNQLSIMFPERINKTRNLSDEDVL